MPSLKVEDMELLEDLLEGEPVEADEEDPIRRNDRDYSS
jgi:hypothetical protein